MTDPRRAFVALGSNLGDRAAYLARARDALAALPDTTVRAASRVYETAPQDVTDQPAFLNQVVCLETRLAPRELLRACRAIESANDRRRQRRFGPRTLDVDILLFQGVETDDPELTLPHPRMMQRAFVLAPLAEVWGWARDMPDIDVSGLASALSRDQAVRPYDGTEARTVSTGYSAQQAELRELAGARHAVVLAHNYQRAEVQEAADFVGDSLELARKAAATDAEVILFCGVHFMAETAKILSPQKTVLMPDARAGCPMANMITAADVRALRAEHPDAAVVAYVNTTAAVKAEVDVCCTSANAAEIVGRIPAEREIVFVPDQHLGDWVQRQTGRRMVLWPGYCPIHAVIQPDDIRARRAEHPDAKVMAHPECSRAVVDMADVVTSTSGMLRYPETDAAPEYIVATEVGLLTGLRKRHPARTFVPATEYSVCPNMKLTTLDSAIESLREGRNEITVADDVREKALRAVTRMVE